MNTPLLMIIRGVPGGGKSYLAKAIVDELGAANALVLDPDQIDQTSAEYRKHAEALSQQGVDEKFHLYRFSRQKAFDAITKKKTIIWNQGFMDFNGLKVTIDKLRAFAKEHGIDLPVLIVEVEIDPDTARTRIAGRVATGGHNVPDEALHGFFERYQSFAGKGFTTVTVSGTDDINKSARTVLTALQNLA